MVWYYDKGMYDGMVIVWYEDMTMMAIMVGIMTMVMMTRINPMMTKMTIFTVKLTQ